MLFATEFPATLCLALALAASQQALAVNDWSVPCTQGQCSWDIPADSSASGTVQIWGSPSAISDITNATGWQITTSCDPNTTRQEIQLVCQNNNPDCDHLFQGGGAVNTIVRMPDGCGPVPFARVAQHQTLQSNLSSRAGEAPVHELTLDTNFSAVTPSQSDNVHFSIQGINSKGDANSEPPAPTRRSHRRRVGLLANSRGRIHQRPNFLNSGLNAPRGLESDIKGLNTFNHTLQSNPTPINFSGITNLFNKSIECPSSSASVSLDVEANVQMTVDLSAVAAGTLVPPAMTEFALNFALGGNVDANLSVVANIAGQASSGSISLFQIGIPGLSFPGILDIGPQFKLSGKMDAKFELNNINAVVDLNYPLSGISFSFPPESGSQLSGITPSAKQVTISPSQEIGATFGATGHLIPELDIGLTALGIVSASVFLNLDASATFNVSTASSTSPQPCVTATTDLNVGVGAQGSFFNFFNSSTASTSLFNKEFPLFQKCFATVNSTSTESSTSTASSTSSTPSAPVQLFDLRRRHGALRAWHLAPFGGSLRPLNAMRRDLSCP